jgi:hypothetical protein
MAIEALNINLTVSAGDPLDSAGVAHTKGDWTEIDASAAVAATGLILSYNVSGLGDFLLDIGAGGAGAEVAIVENIPGQRQTGSSNLLFCIYVPIAIASGTRLSARFQSTTGVGTYRLQAYLVSKDTVGFDECTTAVTYGADTADSGGAEVDPGATIHTKGAYTELSASTSADIKWLIVGVGNKNNTARTDAFFLVDIATGAAASESVVVPNLCFIASSTMDSITPQYYPAIPIEIASGTRLSARAQSGINDAGDRLLDLIVIGLNGTASGGGGGGRGHFSASFMG